MQQCIEYQYKLTSKYTVRPLQHIFYQSKYPSFIASQHLDQSSKIHHKHRFHESVQVCSCVFTIFTQDSDPSFWHSVYISKTVNLCNMHLFVSLFLLFRENARMCPTNIQIHRYTFICLSWILRILRNSYRFLFCDNYGKSRRKF